MKGEEFYDQDDQIEFGKLEKASKIFFKEILRRDFHTHKFLFRDFSRCMKKK